MAASKPADLTMVVPTYNERDRLGELATTLFDACGQHGVELELVIVDDNSPDGTGAIADELARSRRMQVIHRAGKLGLGTAYLEGFEWALARDYQLIVEMDADFSHDPKFLPTFLSAIEQADLVLGSRYKSGVNVINWPISRLLLSLGANQYARWVTGLPLSDSTGGFKCFRRQVLEAIELERVRSNGYSFQIEMSFRAWKKGFRLVEIPIVFTDRVEGQSKMNGRIVREAIWMVWWLRLQGIFGRI